MPVRSLLRHVQLESLAAGLSGGVVSTLVLHPLDLVKIRFAGGDGDGGRRGGGGGLLAGGGHAEAAGGWAVCSQRSKFAFVQEVFNSQNRTTVVLLGWLLTIGVLVCGEP